jgi:fatty acid desaturase
VINEKVTLRNDEATLSELTGAIKMFAQQTGAAFVTNVNKLIPRPGDHVIPQATNAVKILLLVAALLAVFVAMNILTGLALRDEFATAMRGLALLGLLLLAIFASMLMLAMGILAHDGVHRVLFRSAFVNDLASGLLSAFGGGLPFYANRQFHLKHHAHAHQGEEDSEHNLHHPSFFYAFFIGPLAGFVLQYKLMFSNLWKGLREPKFLARAAKDFGCIAAAVMFYTVGFSALGISPLKTILPAMLVLPFTFSFRALSDHFGLPRVKTKSERYRETPENNQQVTGWVIITTPWLEWLWSSVNYHEVHHKFPYLSHLYLKQAYAATRDTYPYREARGYIRSLISLRNKDYYSKE